MCAFSWRSLLSKLVPESWTLDPREHFRISTVIQPFSQYPIAVSSSSKEIYDHWTQLENELYPNLKKLDNSQDKLELLKKFVNKKHEREERDKTK
ncbi:hypothetical protein SAMD00019534_093870 [Acytostelium subglobosum LB1]|uniref:hypothetical protein n=1 Tax=Acytostelium subglobosum LB1 TaxID=1410327 RepID=UPI0006449DE0|nr:hypothetical protein SAMD00019534_093870 [Acytostelium subglobosum LB1]GAM26212.1 hypothetical protein SAMD00019534_093870 [Acytostelium subglobosum LB1]|eukprot:XP_012750766.1 hypothetical protein SAMD00019534_093870 [Acytostelium subglobosum LB1]